jgi:hypothetical protein
MSPAALSHDVNGGQIVREFCRQAIAGRNLEWSESNALVLRRGPYLVAAGLDEASAAGQWAKVLRGRFISLFDPELKVVGEVTLEAGKRALLVDLDKVGAGPKVVAAACRVEDEVVTSEEYSFRCEGIKDSAGVVCAVLPGKVGEVRIDNKVVGGDAARFEDGVLRLRFVNRPEGVEVHIRY